MREAMIAAAYALAVVCALQFEVSCASTPGMMDTAQSVYVIEDSLAAALDAASAYASLPHCAPGVTAPCSDVATIGKIHDAGVLAFAAVQTAETAARGGASASAVQADVDAATKAVQALEALIPATKVSSVQGRGRLAWEDEGRIMGSSAGLDMEVRS